MKITLLLGLVLLATTAHAYRDCYMCDSSEDFKSSKNCDFKKPKLDKINTGRWVDEKKECVACYKLEDASGEVTRGCISKDTYQAYKDTFGIKNKDSCKDESGIGELCVCEANLCNGAGVTVLSLTVILSAAILNLVL